MKNLNHKPKGQQTLRCSDLLGVIYRDVTMREKITSDGVRRIEYTWQVFHDASGRELSNENARLTALNYLKHQGEEPILGYPCHLSLREVFWNWPEFDALNSWLLRPSEIPNYPARMRPKHSSFDTPRHLQSPYIRLKCLFRLLRSYFLSGLMTPNESKLSHSHWQQAQPCNDDSQCSFPGQNWRGSGCWLQRVVRRQHRHIICDASVPDPYAQPVPSRSALQPSRQNK